MEKIINYSIIIPHKNSTKLLNRCLKSIPKRDDLEIIVIDDNSDDFQAVEAVVRDYLLASLYKNEGYGAGGARNTGISKAKGTWLLFADCDDYYVEGFLTELDKYVTSDFDVIYFNFFQYIDGQKEPVYEKVSNYITECAAGRRNIDYVKYRNNTPWNKMVKRFFIESKHIRFEEQPIGNDIFFSYQVGYLSMKYLVIDSKIYNYIIYYRSQTKSQWNDYKIKTFIENTEKYNGFMEYVGHKEWTHGFLFLCLQIYKMKDKRMMFRSLWYYFSHITEIRKVRNKYPMLLNEKQQGLSK